MLVLIFQDGRFEGFLDFTSRGALDQSNAIFLFAVIFGLSTDYGVFLLGRIKEARDSGESDREAVAEAVKLIEQAEEVQTLSALADAVGYAPHHFQRIFKRDLGVSPAEYARGLRNQRTEAALKANGRVTDAVYEAGYSAPSSFYSDAKERLGMTPSAWRNGGRGETIRWTYFDSPLGQMLIAATSKGICRLTFDDSEGSLRRLFPNATIVEDSGGLKELVEGARAAIDSPLAARELPIDVLKRDGSTR
mgnify:CR=1 FL=1